MFLNEIMEKDSCKLRPEAATRSEILYLCGQGNVIFIRVKSVILFENLCLWQPHIWSTGRPGPSI